MYIRIAEMLASAHRMMEHVLTLIRLQADMLHSETDAKELTFLQKAIAYMHNYPGLIHHPAEELIFERLQNLAPDTTPLCTKLTEQHRQFSILEIALLAYIAQAQQGDKGICGLIKKLSSTYCVEHVDHLSLEENDLLPQAGAFLTRNDWLDIGYKSNLDMDPLANPDVLRHHESLYDYIMSTDPSLKAH